MDDDELSGTVGSLGKQVVAATTVPPTHTEADIVPLSCDLLGNVRVI